MQCQHSHTFQQLWFLLKGAHAALLRVYGFGLSSCEQNKRSKQSSRSEFLILRYKVNASAFSEPEPYVAFCDASL